jgi:ribosomal-protein-alanine N-acetyltransferase
MNILETQRLALRHLTADDAEFLIKLLNDPAFIQNIGDRGVRTIADAHAYIQNGPAASYTKNGFGLDLVILKNTGESIGICGLIKREVLEDVDIGYAFLPSYRSKGYAVEAALAVKKYAKEAIGLKRLVAIVDPANAGSIRVLEKIGFKFEKMIKLSEGDIDIELFACSL